MRIHLNSVLSSLACGAVLLAVAAPAQRLLVSADSSGPAGMYLRGYRPCTGQADGLFIPFGGGGFASPRSARGGPNGHIYVASEVNDNVVEFDANGAFVRVFVASGSGGLNQPYALDFGPDGHLYVTSWGNAQGSRVVRYHGATGALLGTFATLPSSVPQGLVFAPNGNLYVSSLQGHVVYECQAGTGTLVRTLSGSLSWPAGMAIGADGRLHVANSGSNSVARFDVATGAPLGLFVPSGSGGLSSPRDIAVDPRGNLLVSSFGGGGIKEYDAVSGAFLGDRVPPVVQPFPLSVAVIWPAGVRPYGRSTGGSAGRPCIGAGSTPLPGNAGFAITCSGVPPLTAGGLGLSRTALAAPLTLAGAGIWIDLGAPFLGVLPLASDAAGSAAIALPIPPDPLLAGLRVFAQAGWPEGGTPGGLAASRALDLTIQGPAAPPPPPPPITTVVASPAPVPFSYSSYPVFTAHPNLQHVFTPAAPETVSVAVNAAAFQMASCLSPWMYGRIVANNTVIAQGSIPIGTQSIALGGSFTSIPGQTNVVMFLVSFDCPSIYVPQAQVPPAGGAATLTLVRTPV